MAEDKILARGAEAILIQSDSSLIKRRITKGYRLPVLDEKLRKQRTKSEAKIMEKLQGKINVPKIIKVDEKNKEIIMEFIQGKKLSNYLDLFALQKQIDVMKEIGAGVSKIHDLDLIHGDLTTSNMIYVESKAEKGSIKKVAQDCENSLINNNLCEKVEAKGSKHNKIEKNSELITNFKVFFIDFGLGFHSIKIEDKAVDIHLFKQALEAKHFQNWEKLFKAFLQGYFPKDKDKIIKQLEKVELRGRYKH